MSEKLQLEIMLQPYNSAVGIISFQLRLKKLSIKNYISIQGALYFACLVKCLDALTILQFTVIYSIMLCDILFIAEGKYRTTQRLLRKDFLILYILELQLLYNYLKLPKKNNDTVQCKSLFIPYFMLKTMFICMLFVYIRYLYIDLDDF